MAAPNFADKTIWTGDNLDMLRGMNSECADLIYLDPPFNSNRNYAAPVGSRAAGAAFKDTWTLSDLDVAWMGLIADEQPAVANLLHTAKLTHGKGMQSYLTMMAVRLLEMRRVLKETGSIYLHCDPTASHYLKLLMDAVFGSANFRNEVVWSFTGRLMFTPYRFNAKHNSLLFYAKSKGHKLNEVTETITRDEYVQMKKQQIHIAEDGREWIWGHAGKGKSHEYRIYIDEVLSKGRHLSTVWRIPIINTSSKERVGYPTQKPLALLERIIQASSNPGDVVLDPFCGCATACVAADQLGRKWVGIDISPKAGELVNMRLRQAMGSLFHHGYVTARTDIPRRTDIDAPIPYRQNKHVLFGQQEGMCNGCGVMFPFRNFTVDHMVPQSRGGTDHLDNLQLLCGACNSVKGDRPQEHLIAGSRRWRYERRHGCGEETERPPDEEGIPAQDRRDA